MGIVKMTSIDIGTARWDELKKGQNLLTRVVDVMP